MGDGFGFRSFFFQLNGLDTDLGDSLVDKSKLLGGSPGQVDDPFPGIWIMSTGEGTSIIHSDDDRASVFQICHVDVNRKRQVLMGRRQGSGVEQLAVGRHVPSFLAPRLFPIP